uniref:Kazal-like domain-containing protein n=1 Tax=Ascaris lumbricoides TaxID=6252 RepID=A0A9J2Q8L9_ASCLU
LSYKKRRRIKQRNLFEKYQAYIIEQSIETVYLPRIWESNVIDGEEDETEEVQCEKERCPYGSFCYPSSGQCECKTSCQDTGPTVCGTDNVTYASECHLSVRSCLSTKTGKKEIRLRSIGACGVIMPVSRNLHYGSIIERIKCSIYNAIHPSLCRAKTEIR